MTHTAVLDNEFNEIPRNALKHEQEKTGNYQGISKTAALMTESPPASESSRHPLPLVAREPSGGLLWGAGALAKIFDLSSTLAERVPQPSCPATTNPCGSPVRASPRGNFRAPSHKNGSY